MKRYLSAAGAAVSFSLATANTVLADQGHTHGHESFVTAGDEHTHGSETGNVRTSDNIIDIYGRLYLSLLYNDPGMEDSENELMLDSHGTVLGIRGNKSLTQGGKLFWQIESDIDLDNLGAGDHHGGGNGSELASQNTFVGISGSLGTVLAGKHDTPYKLVVHGADPFSHIPGDALTMLGHAGNWGSLVDDHHGTVFHITSPNTIVYFSPALGGFSVNAAVLAIDKVDKSTITGEGTAEEPIGMNGASVSLNYKLGGLDVSYAFEYHSELEWAAIGAAHVHAVDECTSSACELADSSQAHLLSVMYHFPSTMVGVVMESITVDAAESMDRLAWRVIGQQNFGPHSLRAAFTQAGEFEENDGGQQLAIGWFHALSDSTHAYADVVMVSNDDEAHFAPNMSTEVEDGSDPSTVAFGVIHKF